METLSARQQTILNRVVETHIATGEPVGSRALLEVLKGKCRES